MKLECSVQNLEKSSNIKFYDKPSSGSRVVSCGQTDERTHDEANGRFSQFCESAQKMQLHNDKNWTNLYAS